MHSKGSYRNNPDIDSSVYEIANLLTYGQFFFIWIPFLFLLSGCGFGTTDRESVPDDTLSTAEVDQDAVDSAHVETMNENCGLDISTNMTDADAIRVVLESEGQLVVAQDIDSLMKLWAPGSKIHDAKNTPTSTIDDQTWDDKDAIRHRYVRIVFPGAPSSVQPSNLQITIEDTTAIVTSTTQIDSEISPAGDRWVLSKQDGCWRIQSLTYNLESN